MRARLVLAAGVLVVTALAITPELPGVLRAMAGSALLLLIPGAAFSTVLFPSSMRWSDRLLVSISVSAAVGALGALLLNLTPAGLTGHSWAVLLAGISLAFIAASRDRGLPARIHRPRRPSANHALILLAIAVAVGALVIGRTQVSATGIHGYSELWVTRPGSSADQVMVGVRSEEFRRTSYRLLVTTDGGRRLANRRFSLDPDTQARFDVPLGNLRSGGVVGLLYRHGTGRPYRRVRLVLG